MNILRRGVLAALLILSALPALTATVDDEGMPIFYLRGAFGKPEWGYDEAYRFTRQAHTYILTVPALHGEFKISNDNWSINYGGPDFINGETIVTGIPDGPNFNADLASETTISFIYPGKGSSARIMFSGHGEVISLHAHSGTLPVLHINVYNSEGQLDNEIISRDLAHKEYFSGNYWLDVNGCAWLEELGAKSVGSETEPLPLQIKARGNWTRRGFSKKPFKLKLDKKQALLGLSKSKHFAILAHADDNYGYLRNFVGFELGKRIGLPWTPSQQPIEVYINGDYRGLYFLTESIRIDPDRVDINELADMETDPALVSGGYLVELDNYDEANQIRMEEKGCVGGYRDMLRVTFDTPEEYSDIQRRFVTDQFSAINDLVGDNDDRLWAYLDLDDAARYYLCEEIISHVEAFHGSTYLFRDRGENRKWHFSPLWDCGNAFNGPVDDFFYNKAPFGTTWVPSFRANAKFNEKVRDTWLWFMSNCYEGLAEDILLYCTRIADAAVCDRQRWQNEPAPAGGLPVADNSDIYSRMNAALNHLADKTEWLKTQFGDYSGGVYPESPRDDTPAAELPPYVSSIVDVQTPSADGPVEYYNLQGIPVAKPRPGDIILKKTSTKVAKIIYK